MARDLRYISKDLYEKGEKYAEDIQKKFFEYYGLPDMVGGRRTAAAVAARYLRRIPCISTIYVASSECRALIQYNEHGVSKSVLIRLGPKEMEEIAGAAKISPTLFKKHYMVEKEGKSGVFVFKTTYATSAHALPSEGGKLREIVPEPYWMTVDYQQILPRSDAWDWSPISCNLIYT